MKRVRCTIICLSSVLIDLAPGPAVAEEQTPGYDTSVRERFADAVRLFKDEQVEEALPMFQTLSTETDSPNVSLYLGHCLVKLGRYVEAYRAFAKTVSATVEQDDVRYEETSEAARLQLAALESRVAKLVIALAETHPNTLVKVDGEALDPTLLGSHNILEPGTHRVEATADGKEPVRREVHIQPGETKTLALAFHDAAEESAEVAPFVPESSPTADNTKSTLKTSGFILSGLAVAGLTTFVAAGLGAKGVHDDLEAACGGSGCSGDAHRDDAARGKTLQVVANTGLIVGALSAIGGGALLYFGYSEESTAGPSVSLGPAGGAVTYGGTF